MSIRSTQHHGVPPPHPTIPMVPGNVNVISASSASNCSSILQPILLPSSTNIIEDNASSNANIFCFAAFADKRTGILYNDLTSPFPFMSLEGNICFLVVYHYKTNAILALPIKWFSNDIIFATYKQQYDMLESKGYKIKLNVMDNQATWVIKKFLDAKQCDLLLVKPNNHCVNAAERAIQIFKAHFIRALATTNSKFPLQL
jgi:hypothetical protein